ncbi:Histone deacetylase complex subunit SAP18 [Fasciolopsis buskii]|uniref:18 kDa Sin3-associated polypeptide n=1 Tax=Fasciolopsis buskii TaxID=27845 RepID=A0A8E0RVJ2_9TREM|nr:Histone deacetylase complex subunit SAP18 [Fasciolopsis buski]
MENGVGRINTLRSLVRPVSPLSRMQNLPYLTDDQNQATISTKRGLGPVNRSRSPSPVLASAVHLARPRASDTDTYPQILNPDGETRRIIVRRPDPSMEIDNLNPAHNAHVDPSCELDFGNNPDGRGSLRRRRSGEADGPRPPPSIAVSTVDREKTCPILIRVSYTTNGRHTPLSEYDKGRFPRNGFSMNTWIDCSLRELAEEVRFVYPPSNRRGTRLHFAVIYPDQRGTYRRRELGVVITGFATSDRSLEDDVNEKKAFTLTDDSSLTLLSKRFHVSVTFSYEKIFDFHMGSQISPKRILLLR